MALPREVVTTESPGTANGLSPSTASRGPRGVDIEAELLVTCATAALTEERRARLLDLVSGELDWNRFLKLVWWHRVTTASLHLHEVASAQVPTKVLDQLHRAAITNSILALARTVELLRLLGVFAKAEILAVPYKGPALSAILYDNVALRPSGDLDVLVEIGDVERARQVLFSDGYAARHNITRASQEFLFRSGHSEIFVKDPGYIVELHWRVANRDMVRPVGLEEMRPRLKTFQISGVEVPTLSPEDLVLVLSIHGATHCWERLEWITGLAESVRRWPEISWEDLLDRTRAKRAEKIVLLGLLLAHELLEAPVPAYVLGLARSQRDVVRLAAVVRERVAIAGRPQSELPKSFPRDMFRLRLQSSFNDRLQFLFHRLTTPRRADIRFMLPLGNRSVPLPALVRPFLVVRKLIWGLLKHPAARWTKKSGSV